MKHWRPLDWVRIKREHCRDSVDGKADCEHCPTEPMECNKSLETGAGAILESLASLVGDNGYITFEKEDGKVVAVYIDD